MLRGRRAERREERQGGDERVHYRMRQRLVSIGDDFWIETDDGQRAYKVDGKALRLRKTLKFEDPSGRELARIQERVARVRDSMEIEDADGNRLAMVKKALVSPLRDRWTVTIGDGPDLEIQGKCSTTSTPSATAAPRLPRCRRSGSGSPTATAWRWPRTRIRCSCWRPRLPST
jgi:hypothetical protein